MDVVIGIDPGATSGWGALTVEGVPDLLLHDRRTWPKPGTKKDTPKNTPSGVVDELIEMLGRLGHTVVGAAIEDQFLKKNPDSMKKLARNGGRWEEAFRSRGIPVEWINAQTWQTRELGSCKIDTAEVKRRCMQKARGIWNKRLRQDEADACIIGRFHAVRKAFARMRGRR